MRALILFGLLLLALGFAAFARRGMAVSQAESAAKSGAVQVSEQARLQMPLWVGGGLIVAGAALVAVGAKKT